MTHKLYLNNNYITNISSLKKMTHALYLSNNGISDLSSL